MKALGQQIERLARQRLFQPRRVFCVAGPPDRINWEWIAALEAEGAEVVIILSGVPRSPDEEEGGMVEFDQGPVS
jgi:hypothetical protein